MAERSPIGAYKTAKGPGIDKTPPGEGGNPERGIAGKPELVGVESGAPGTIGQGSKDQRLAKDAVMSASATPLERTEVHLWDGAHLKCCVLPVYVRCSQPAAAVRR